MDASGVLIPVTVEVTSTSVGNTAVSSVGADPTRPNDALLLHAVRLNIKMLTIINRIDFMGFIPARLDQKLQSPDRGHWKHLPANSKC